ncbi:ferritin [Pelagicoccus sp. SDUM812003]|uniref:ferritin n=1 Tax=Pelagicoccus sp. SDUM812003 TaxID=3041267 RepID=UPI00280E4984|nr:ferritin [Pelagicoccus sp. SDUM812003]MDQ8203642.1 ferritin [Pelagicoccus sp. SDUM812003]
MNDSISKALIDQANHELYAAHCYHAMSIWCETKDYSGFAKFFAEQATEEREHAEKFIDHVIDRGGFPALTSIAVPQTEYGSLSEIALKAEELEKANSNAIKKCYEISLETKDYESQRMLLWFIDEQVEEEAWTEKMVTLVKRMECPGAAYSLDRHIIKELASDE